MLKAMVVNSVEITKADHDAKICEGEPTVIVDHGKLNMNIKENASKMIA